MVSDALSGPERTVISFLLINIPCKRIMTLAQREQVKVELHSGLFENFCTGRMHEYKYASDPRRLFHPSFVHEIIIDIIQSAHAPRDGIGVVTEMGTFPDGTFCNAHSS